MNEWSARYQVQVAALGIYGDTWEFVGARDELYDAEVLAVTVSEDYTRVRIVDMHEVES